MNAAYMLSEVRRTVRNKRFLIFAIGLPLVLFFVISSSAEDGSRLDSLTVTPYIMVSMATFGAMSGVFSTGGRIALERSLGWNRQLRLTALTGRQYVAGKAVTGFAVAVPALLAVFLAGAVKGVSLGAGRWTAIGASVLLALLPICALGIWLGYVIRADNQQAVSGGVYSLLGLLGGLWVPIETFPRWVQDGAQALPVVWVAKAGRAAAQGSWVGWHGLLVLLAWTAVLAALAARAYDRDSARA